MPGDALARIRGIPNIPSIIEFNIRSGPTTSQELIFKVPVGMSGQRILDVQIDAENKSKDGKTYQWFQLQFDGGAIGWIRDDLIEVQGNLTRFGYPDLSEHSFAFAMLRGTPVITSEAETTEATTETETTTETQDSQETETTTSPSVKTGAIWQAPGPTTVPILAPILATGDFPDASADIERVKKISFQFTAAWEGGFRAINTYDSGIVSYGFLQFTLAGGSLINLINKYLENSQTDTANSLRNYQQRVEERDSMLAKDTNFINLLKAATDDPIMIEAQYELATTGYWKSVVNGYITGRELKYPLTWALLFDMGVNFGVNHGFVRLAEKDLGVPARSKPADNGMPEEQLMTYIAQLRKRSHDRQAEKTGYVGLKRRGDFWMQLISSGDWYLQGNASGQIYPNSRTVNVLNP
jgi:glycosyl hydrolase family 46